MNAATLNRIKKLEVVAGGDRSRQLPMIVGYDRIEADWNAEEKHEAAKYRSQGYTVFSFSEFADNCF